MIPVLSFRSWLLLLLACLAFAAEARSATESAVLHNLAAGRIQSIEITARNKADADPAADYYIASFEPPHVCADFDLTADEVRDFFKRARQVARKSSMDRATERIGDSRCSISGNMVLQDGTLLEWEINRVRNGTITMIHDARSATTLLPFYCASCRSAKFYPPATRRHDAPFRPVVRSVVILKDRFQADDLGPDDPHDPDVCQHFRLSKNEILKFFKTARPMSGHEDNGSHYLGFCLSEGEMILQDGRKANWRIDNGGRGKIWFSGDHAGDPMLRFYCTECSVKKYDQLCTDFDCRGA